MSVPKKRTSHSRTAQRSAHDFATRSNPMLCSACGEPKLRHRVCMSCGTYKGNKLIAGSEATPSS